MKKLNLAAIILIVFAASCKKSTDEKIQPTYKPEFSCLLSNDEFSLNSVTGNSNSCIRLFKLQNNKQDSFLLQSSHDFGSGLITIGFSTRVLLDTNYNAFPFLLYPDIEIKKQIFSLGNKEITRIKNQNYGFYIEYRKPVDEFNINGFYKKWSSYLKENNEFDIDDKKYSQELSKCSINKIEINENDYYLEATFNCTLINAEFGDTIHLSNGVCKVIF